MMRLVLLVCSSVANGLVFFPARPCAQKRHIVKFRYESSSIYPILDQWQLRASNEDEFAIDGDDDVSPSDIEDIEIEETENTEGAASYDDDVSPSDIEVEEAIAKVEKEASTSIILEQNRNQEKNLEKEKELLSISASTSRGALASDFERADVDGICRELEKGDPGEPLEGRWRLVYSSEAGIYRSSPFFWGFKKLLEFAPEAPLQLRNSRDSSYAENVFALTDGLPLYEIGNCFHTITPDSLVSEVEVQLKLFDSLLPRATTIMTTSARSQPLVRDGRKGLTLTLESTRIAESTLETLFPPVFGFLGDFSFPTESAFSQLADRLGDGRVPPDAAVVDMYSTYTSDTLRITRTNAGMLFVHLKESEPTSFW